MCNRALELDPNLAEGRYLRGRLLWTPVTGFDHAGALREFAGALSIQPSLHQAHRWLGTLFFHVSMLDESQEEIERCMAIDPRDRSSPMHLATLMYMRGRFSEALAMAEESGREASSAWDRYTVALAQIQLGRLDAAEETASEASRRFPGEVLFDSVWALIAAKRGERARALQFVDLTVRNQKAFGHYHHAQYDVACVYAQLGDRELALQWLSDAASNGFPCGVFFARDPLLAPIHGDARFEALIASTKAECDAYASLYRELRRSVS
jgi:tetratricopeptide (TPR) repeat protein